MPENKRRRMRVAVCSMTRCGPPLRCRSCAFLSLMMRCADQRCGGLLSEAMEFLDDRRVKAKARGHARWDGQGVQVKCPAVALGRCFADARVALLCLHSAPANGPTGSRRSGREIHGCVGRCRRGQCFLHRHLRRTRGERRGPQKSYHSLSFEVYIRGDLEIFSTHLRGEPTRGGQVRRGREVGLACDAPQRRASVLGKSRRNCASSCGCRKRAWRHGFFHGPYARLRCDPW